MAGLSNKDSLEFNFTEEELVKKCPLFENCTNIVVGKGMSRRVYNVISPGEYEDGEYNFW